MALYPPALLYSFLPVPWSITAFSFVHLLLAAAGMYALAFRWTGHRFAAAVAGLAFAWNGITLHSQMWPNSCASLGWMPWVVLLAERALKEGRRWTLYAGLVGALQLLAGVPEIILFTWLIVLGVTVVQWREASGARRAVVLRLLAVGLIVAGLTAAQLLPFLDLLAHSQRGKTYATDTWSLPPWGWANLLVPLFRTSPDALGVYSQDEQQWASSYYLGIGVLALAIAGLRRLREPRVALLLALSLIGLVFALGSHGYVYDTVRNAVPFLNVLRYPAKWVQVTLFAVPLLAAFGIAWLSGQRASSALRRHLASSVFLFLGLIAVVLAAARLWPRPDEPWPAVWGNGVARATVLLVFLALLWVWIHSVSFNQKRLLGLALLALLGLDVAFHVPRQNPTVPARLYAKLEPGLVPAISLGEGRAMMAPEAKQFLRRAAHPDPVEDFLGKRRALYMNANLLDRVPKVDGLFSLYPKEFAEIESALYQRGKWSSAFADFLGAAHISSQQSFMWWEPRPSAMPLATAGQQPQFTDDSLEALFSRDFEPNKTVLLPREAAGKLRAAQHVPGAEVEPVRVAAHELAYRVRSPEPTLLVLSQTFYHNWRATVNGQPAPIWRANHAFQAIEVPAGESTVRLVYQDRLFLLGLSLGVATLAICLVAWRRWKKV